MANWVSYSQMSDAEREEYTRRSMVETEERERRHKERIKNSPLAKRYDGKAVTRGGLVGPVNLYLPTC